MPNEVVHVISHTHWDREWYMPFELHRRRLVTLLDELLELLDADAEFRHFHLDGQTIPVQDYLEIRPHRRERVRTAAQAGRLSMGPWYVLQDEFLVSGEANVRNLLYGLKAAQEFAEPLRVGYLADAFGHISQMPQILRGFGIDNAVFGRGVNRWNPEAPPEAPPGERGYKSEFWWEAPDGSRVLAVFLANWYSNGMEMPTDPAACREWLEARLADCRRYATTPHLLLMNGCDHTPAQKNITTALRVARRLFPELEFRHGRLDDYIRAVQAAVGDLDTVRGELRSRFTDGWGTLTNVLSSRLNLKQSNWRCQRELEKWAEPFGAFDWLLGGSYDHDLMDYSWRMLLQNHPHDSICGCSCDEVHSEMDLRFLKSGLVANQLAQEAMTNLAARVDTSAAPPGARAVVVFNPLPFPRTELVLCSVDFPPDSTITNAEGFDGAGQPMAGQLEHDHGVVWDYRLPPDRFREGYTCRRICLTVPVSLPPLGYATCFVRPSSRPSFSLPAENVMRNECLAVTLQEDGSLGVTDLKTGVRFTGLNQIQYSRDAGDEYNYRIPTEDVVWNLQLRLDDQVVTPLYDQWTLVGSVTDGGTVEVRSTVALTRHGRRIDIRTEITNQTTNHRLRALFPTDTDTDFATADGQFDLVRRPIHPWSGWRNPSNCQPQQAFVDVSDEQKGLTVANMGLPEYEVLRDGRNTIALTLLRAVGEIGDWGEFPTPDAQCPGDLLVEYAVIPHGGKADAECARREAYSFTAPPLGIAAEIHPGPLPPTGSFLDLEPATLVLSAVKKCETRDSLIIRFYNPEEKSCAAKLTSFWSFVEAYRTNLNEERQAPLSLSSQVLDIPVEAKEIVTVELVPAAR